MLQYNPALRSSAKEIMGHSYFDSIRVKLQEIDAPFCISQEIHDPHVINYERNIDNNYIEDYRCMLEHEIEILRSHIENNNQNSKDKDM